MAALVTMLRMPVLQVRVGSLLPEITEPTTLDLPDGASLTLEPLKREGNRLIWPVSIPA